MLVGIGQKIIAMAKIPLEGALAEVDFAAAMTAFATPGGQAEGMGYLAASAAHIDAMAQLAKVAGGSTSTSKSHSGGGSGGSSSSQASAPPASPVHRSTVVVNVGDGVVTNPKEFAKQIVLGLNEAYRDNVNIEFAG